MIEAEQLGRLFYECERRLKVRTVPADGVRSLLLVDFFPMSL